MTPSCRHFKSLIACPQYHDLSEVLMVGGVLAIVLIGLLLLLRSVR